MKPLNYAILQYFAEVNEADADQAMKKLEGEYSKFRTFKKKSFVEALMTAEANGILEETHVELDDKGELRVFYRATTEGKETIKKYIGI